MYLWNMKDGKATFFVGGKKCLALRQKGSQITGTRMFELVSDKKDKRGLPLRIFRELSLEECKNRTSSTSMYIDVNKEKVIKKYYHEYSDSPGIFAVFHEEEVTGEEAKEFVKDIIEQVKKAGTYTETRKAGKYGTWAEGINCEIFYQVEVINGLLKNWEVLEEKWWRGFVRYIGTEVTDRYESEDGRMITETKDNFVEGSSEKPISDKEKEQMRFNIIYDIEKRLKYEQKPLKIKGLKTLDGAKYVIKILNKMLEGLV